MKNTPFYSLKQIVACVTLSIVTCMLAACGSDKPVEEPEKPNVEQPTDNPTDVPTNTPTIWDDQGWITATEAIQDMGLGWNLGNTLDACDFSKGFGAADWKSWETCWGQPVTSPELLQMIKDAGYGAVRVPITWKGHLDANGKVNAQWMNRVKQVVDYVMNTGMYCIINVHHDTGADENAWLVASMKRYNENKTLYEGLWKQIAETFIGYDERLMFESYNEMLDERRSWCFSTFAGGYDTKEAADAYKAINSYAQSFVDVVRATGGNNVGRNLIVNTYGACNGGGTWNPHLIDPLVEMKLPTDVVENHLIFQVHTYPDITNLDNAKAEVSSMIANLKKYLVTKGAPVIIGEWGSGGESQFTVESKSAFIYDFVKQAKAADMGIYYWMGISDATARQLPAFNEPEYALAMLKAYHGDDYSPELPTMDNMEYDYVVTYNALWSEANLCNQEFSLDNYKGIKIELGEKPQNGTLNIKVYGESEGDEQYSSVADAESVLTFDKTILGEDVRRITLQCMVDAQVKATIKRIVLIKTDDTEEVQTPSVFWGCTIDLQKK
ncbi:MAG: glycoside hydrolase family 5 protein [Bacteroides sp.]|nr:glycoside hydrolase family 5 protein [Bacteroides sp.]